ncbi:Alpha-N-Acetylgalactosaminide Alpha-2,6-Sialyltransferase 3 [Manis pentadactyla]|nr:Alpha-N-Acetylgalactosaminide Alpha-2,6-Sialyltransferase 3 [Manis pentadactyla]
MLRVISENRCLFSNSPGLRLAKGVSAPLFSIPLVLENVCVVGTSIVSNSDISVTGKENACQCHQNRKADAGRDQVQEGRLGILEDMLDEEDVIFSDQTSGITVIGNH